MFSNYSSKAIAKGPDFIGIGAARSGTTWLAKQLGSHAELWLPYRKELHYFSRHEKYMSPSYLSDCGFLKRIVGLERRNITFKHKLIAAIGGSLLKKDFDRLSWEIRYFAGDSSEEWYKSLFPDDGRITGEITPAYALLDDHIIKDIVRMNPDIKIIYIVRNPVERAWSTLKYHVSRGNTALMDFDDLKMIDYLNQPAIVERSNYMKVIKKWMHHVREDNFLLLYYDDIVSRPNYVVNKLERFLGIATSRVTEQPVVHEKVNQSFYMQIPDSIRVALCRTYYESIEDLSNLFGGTAIDWLKYTRKYIG